MGNFQFIYNPDLCYRMNNQQIPFTTQYIDYLSASIEDAIKKTDMDGIMLDWFYNPEGGRDPLPNLRWLPCEQVMYQELMNQPFPGKDKITPEIELDFRRKTIDRTWKNIRAPTKKTKPDCITWLKRYKVDNKDIAESDLLKQVDWLNNEAGDIASIEGLRSSLGNKTKLIGCLADWNKQDPEEIVPAYIKANIGLYGFTKPVVGALMPPIDMYLSQPISDFIGDAKSIAILARAYKGLPFDYIKQP